MRTTQVHRHGRSYSHSSTGRTTPKATQAVHSLEHDSGRAGHHHCDYDYGDDGDDAPQHDPLYASHRSTPAHSLIPQTQCPRRIRHAAQSQDRPRLAQERRRKTSSGCMDCQDRSNADIRQLVSPSASQSTLQLIAGSDYAFLEAWHSKGSHLEHFGHSSDFAGWQSAIHHACVHRRRTRRRREDYLERQERCPEMQHSPRSVAIAGTSAPTKSVSKGNFKTQLITIHSTKYHGAP